MPDVLSPLTHRLDASKLCKMVEPETGPIRNEHRGRCVVLVTSLSSVRLKSNPYVLDLSFA